jgi:hypothetical protein
MPELIVLLPARNAENTVGSAVSTTLRTLPRDAQLLVLDDGSSDNTAARAEAAAKQDPRVTVVSRPGAGGLGPALNWMLEQADCRLVSRMDADDISLPGRFRLPMAAINRGTDMAFTQMADFSGWKVKPSAPIGITPAAFPLQLLLTNPVGHPTMVAKRETIDHYRDVPAEDYDLWLRCAAHGAQMRRLGMWGLLCRQHPGRLTLAAGWRSSSWENPDQAEAFADLSEKLTGKRLQRIVAIAHLADDKKAAALAEFAELITAASAELPFGQRQLVRRRLAERLNWAKNYRPQPTSQGK